MRSHIAFYLTVSLPVVVCQRFGVCYKPAVTYPVDLSSVLQSIRSASNNANISVSRHSMKHARAHTKKVNGGH